MLTKAELIEKLTELATKPNFDPEQDHGIADKLLLEYINDPIVTELFDQIEKWYA